MSNFFTTQTSHEQQQNKWWLLYVDNTPALDEYKRQNNLEEMPRYVSLMRIDKNEIYPPIQIEEARKNSDFYVVAFDEKRMAFCRVTEDN